MKGNNMAPTLKGHNQPPKELNDFLILDSDGSRPRAYMFPPLEPTAQEYWIKHLRSATNTHLGIQYGMTVAFDPETGSTKNKKNFF